VPRHTMAAVRYDEKKGAPGKSLSGEVVERSWLWKEP